METLNNQERIATLEQQLSEQKQSLLEYENLLREHRLLNKQLEIAERAKSHFLSNIRNEIINPFGSILGLSENIRQLEEGQLDKAQTMAALIYQEAFKLNFQLRNIFAAAEIESGEISIASSQIDFDALLQRVAVDFRYHLQEKRLRLKAGASQPIGAHNPREEDSRRLFRTDPDKLELILSNLLAHAIAYCRPEQALEVSYTIRASALQIIISNGEAEIGEKSEGSIFEQPSRFDTSATERHLRQGLGLSVVKAFLDVLGGAVESRALSPAGTWVVTIPEAPKPEEGDDFADGHVLFFNSPA